MRPTFKIFTLLVFLFLQTKLAFADQNDPRLNNLFKKLNETENQQEISNLISDIVAFTIADLSLTINLLSSLELKFKSLVNLSKYRQAMKLLTKMGKTRKRQRRFEYLIAKMGFEEQDVRYKSKYLFRSGSSFFGYPHWNVGGWTNLSSVDDVGLIDFLIELISQEYNINHDRIYATGMSNGGFFSFLLGCQLSEKFAAVASVTGSMTNETFNECNPKREVPILQIHGTDDSIVTYNGNSAIGSIGVSQVLSYWSSNNYCSTNPEVSDITDSNPNDNIHVQRFLFDGGINGSVVEHYKIYGGEHVWFNYEDINSSELIWEFFSNHDINGYID
mgnify:CR=1 FL=1